MVVLICCYSVLWLAWKTSGCRFRRFCPKRQTQCKIIPVKNSIFFDIETWQLSNRQLIERKNLSENA
jgi:hypothetical protein